MRVLIASSEVYPFSKTGGLADMVGALAKYLAADGHEVGVVSPFYRCVRKGFPEIEPFDWSLDLPHGATRVRGKVKIHEESERLRYYFIDEADFFDRDGIYQSEGMDFVDNADRFIFFSKCVTHLAHYLPWKPEIVHAHDWQCGLVPLFVRHQADTEAWSEPPATCLTIHNLAFQGSFAPQYYALTNLPETYFTPQGLEFYGRFNCLKAGIVYADVVTTVSPKYAEEIQTKDYGCGLDGVLRERASVLHGILNGVDYEEWRTTGNPKLTVSYEAGEMSGKQKAKAALQKDLGLEVDDTIPLFGNVSRLTDQKGSDLILEAVQSLIQTPIQFVLLGSGSKTLQVAFEELAKSHSDRIAVTIGYDHEMSHRIEAGCDFFLMPSRFEPCGLNQLYSLRYGTVPIVRSTGGLDDTIIDEGENAQKADGIKFDEISAAALQMSMKRAIALFQDKEKLRRYQENGMRKDYSWKSSAAAYAEVYAAALGTASRPDASQSPS